MAGWLYFFGFICFVPMTMSAVGYLAADLLGREPQAVDPVLLHRHGAVPGPVDHQDQGHHPGPAHRRHRHRGDHPDRRPGHHGQGRQQRPGPVGVHLRHTNSGGFNGVFYGIIFGVTSYIGFETAADFGEETSNPRRYIPIAVIAATPVRRRPLPVDHVLDHDRLRRQQRRGHGRGPGRAEDHRDHLRRRLARHADRDRRHARRVHRLRRLRHGRRAHPVRDGPRGSAARRVRADARRGSRRRSTRPSRWPSSPP